MELLDQLEGKIQSVIKKVEGLEAKVKELEEKNRLLEDEKKKNQEKVEYLMLELDNVNDESEEKLENETIVNEHSYNQEQEHHGY